MTKIVPGQLDDADSIEFGSDDLLDREEFGARLMSLVTDNSGPLVLSLDAPWGEGKTTFLRMWQEMLREADVSTVYLNAFQHDQAEDPFVPLVATIIDTVDRDPNAKRVAEIQAKAGVVGAHLFSWGTKFAARAAALGLADAHDPLAATAGESAERSSRAVAQMVADRISTYSEEIRESGAFCEHLAEFLREGLGGAARPLVFIIDELDRCRPSFAVQLLERIKHVLCVPLITYVLAYHQDQMEEAVRGVYGRGIDARAYLTKFVHIRCALPKRTGSKPSFDDTFAFCESRLASHELELSRDTHDGIMEALPSLACAFDLSLRAIERVFTQLAIFYTAIGETRFSSPGIVGPLAVLRVKHPAVYRNLRDGDLDYHGLLEQVPQFARSGDRGLEWCKDWLRVCFLTDAEFAALGESDGARDLAGTLERFDLTRAGVVHHICSIFDLFRRG